jgi:hypothetical protein
MNARPALSPAEPIGTKQRKNGSGNGTTVAGQSFAFRLLTPFSLGKCKMRLLLALIIIVYLVGVGVFLAPTVQSTWNSEPASGFAQSIAQALPDALAWPVRAFHSMRGS